VDGPYPAADAFLLGVEFRGWSATREPGRRAWRRSPQLWESDRPGKPMRHRPLLFSRAASSLPQTTGPVGRTG
jgi:hypothetical protein